MAKALKIAISLQYFKENVKNEIAFWLQIDLKDFFKLVSF